jgi:uncharacterized protein (TIGR02598 family)
MAFSQPSDRSPRRAGFTLVEVTLALGIVAFAFLALLALLPAGNVAFRRAIDLAVCGQIAQRVISDCQNGDFDKLTEADPKSTSADQSTTGKSILMTMRYFDDQGREIIPATPKRPNRDEIAHAVYWVNTRVIQTAPLPRNANHTVRPPERTLGQVAPLNPMAQLTVQVVHNPNLIDLNQWIDTSTPDDPNKPLRNLIVDSREGKIHLDILTYSAMIGRQ